MAFINLSLNGIVLITVLQLGFLSVPPLRLSRINNYCTNTEIKDVNKILVDTGLLVKKQKDKEVFSVWFLNPENVEKSCPNILDRWYDVYDQSTSDERFHAEVMQIALPFYNGFVHIPTLHDESIETYLKKSRLILAYVTLKSRLESVNNVDLILTKGIFTIFIKLFVQHLLFFQFGLVRGLALGGTLHVLSNLNFTSSNIVISR